MRAVFNRTVVASLVLAGAPIDTDAGQGPIREMAHDTPLEFYESLVELGEGRMFGRYMLAGWKNMHPKNTPRSASRKLPASA